LITFAERLFCEKANFIANKCFQPDFIIQSTKWHQEINEISKHLLLSWVNWHRKLSNSKIAENEAVSNMVLTTGYMIHLITCVILRNNDRLWWMVGLCEEFFDFLLKRKYDNLVNIILDMLSDRPPIAHPEDQSKESDETELFDEYGIALYQKDSKEAVEADKLVFGTLLSHVASALQLFLDRLGEIMNIDVSMDFVFGFLSQSLNKRLIIFLKQFHEGIAINWRKFRMNLKGMRAYIMETGLNDLWNLLLRTGQCQVAAKAIVSLTPEVASADEPIDSDDETPKERVKSNMIVSSGIPILSFAVNPLDRKQIVYVTSKSIFEVDTFVSENYYTVNSFTNTRLYRIRRKSVLRKML
jgi:hypothetical protein